MWRLGAVATADGLAFAVAVAMAVATTFAFTLAFIRAFTRTLRPARVAVVGIVSVTQHALCPAFAFTDFPRVAEPYIELHAALDNRIPFDYVDNDAIQTLEVRFGVTMFFPLKIICDGHDTIIQPTKSPFRDGRETTGIRYHELIKFTVHGHEH